MKPQAQQIAMAEARGFSAPFSIEKVYFETGENDGFEDALYDAYHRRVPDYLNDLNAVHGAEKLLTYEQQPHYIHAIKRTVMRVSPIGAADDYETATATAAQRLEALLRTLGKWVD